MWRVSGATVPSSRLPTQSPVAPASLWVGLCATRVMTPRPLSTSATSQARLAKAWGPVRRIGCHGGQWVLNPAVIGRQNFLTGVCTFTQGEDACLASLLPILPSADTKQLLEVGALPDVVEDHFARQLKQIGIENVAFLPARHSHDMPVVGTGTHHVLAQPFLADTARPLEGRGAQRIGRRSRSASKAPPPGCMRRRQPLASRQAWSIKSPHTPASAPRWRCNGSAKCWLENTCSSSPIRSLKSRSPASWRVNWAWC